MTADDRPFLLLSDISSGGAAISCRRLYRSLQAQKMGTVRWIAAAGSPGDGAVIASQWPPLLLYLVQRILPRLGASDAMQARFARLLYQKSMQVCVRINRPRLINLHNLHAASDFSLLSALPKSIPLVWTLHDMWPLTGYCCYSYDCEKFASGCVGDCPQAGKWGPIYRQPAPEWNIRERFYSHNVSRLSFVAPSRWFAQCAQKRFGDRFRIEHIPYGLPLEIFKPLGESKRNLRRVLGLPENAFIILCGAQYMGDERKGAKQLIAAVNSLRMHTRIPVVVVAFGEAGKGTAIKNWIFTGTIPEERFLNQYYNAADVFVLPSLADNLPNTLLEATSAGTPCVTFDTGGCAEVVRDGLTGYVAQYGDERQLSECIERILVMSESDRQAMSAVCREVAVREYDQDLQASRYRKLFDEVQ